MRMIYLIFKILVVIPIVILVFSGGGGVIHNFLTHNTTSLENLKTIQVDYMCLMKSWIERQGE